MTKPPRFRWHIHKNAPPSKPRATLLVFSERMQRYAAAPIIMERFPRLGLWRMIRLVSHTRATYKTRVPLTDCPDYLCQEDAASVFEATLTLNPELLDLEN